MQLVHVLSPRQSAWVLHWDIGAGPTDAMLQVSRFFSAMLQLANNGNIVILRGSDPGQAFQLRLASLEKWHQQFQNYRAPSFLQPKVQMQEFQDCQKPLLLECAGLKCMAEYRDLVGACSGGKHQRFRNASGVLPVDQGTYESHA